MFTLAGSYDAHVNPSHPLRGDDAYLILEYSCYVEPVSAPLHPSPRIEQQKVRFAVLSESRREISVSGARNSPYDGIVQLVVDIDEERAFSVGETRSGWNTWIRIVSSFGIKCDGRPHRVQIHVEQWVSEVLGQLGRWQTVLNESRTVTFDKPSGKKT